MTIYYLLIAFMIFGIAITMIQMWNGKRKELIELNKLFK